MKVAVTGKGGVGKTTVAASLARCWRDLGYRVVAVDADPDANLAGTLGYRGAPITPLVQLKKLIEERGFGVHHGLDNGELARRAALDQVTGDRERGSGESNEGRIGGFEFLHHPVDRFGHVSDIDVGHVAKPFEVRGTRERLSDHRTSSGLYIDAESDRVIRHDDVAEEDGGVDAVASNGLHRDLTRQRGIGDRLQYRSRATKRSVFRQ